MINSGILWLSAEITPISLLSITATTAIMRRRRLRPLGTRSQQVSAMPCAGPISKLSFTDSLDPILFAQAAEEEALAYAKLHLGSMLADGVTLTLQILREWSTRSELLVAASSKATKAMQVGRASLQLHKSSQRLLPKVFDHKPGRVMETMKEVGYARKAISAASTAFAIVVAAAHMIATADLARTLKLVDGKLDLLIAHRRIDQDSALERIYASAQELLAAPLDDLRRMELWRLRGDLRELRATWRREFEYHLRQIENPAQEDWIDWVFTSQSSHDDRIVEKISGGLLQVAMVEYSLRLDRVLAIASETWDVSEVTLKHELSAIERVGTVLKDKASFISQQRRASAQPVIDGISAIVLHYRGLLQSGPEPASAPVVSALDAEAVKMRTRAG